MQNHLVCPLCGKTGERSGNWVRPGVAAGDLTTGLDFENCPGCWDMMVQNGIAPGIFTADGNGGHKFTPIPRPATEQKDTSAV
jgi:hypothetical protein